MNTFLADYHQDALRLFRNYKQMAERAIDQISDEQFFAVIDPDSNSIAIIVKHIAGNAWSRWRNFLTSDGEKADRQRDTEFEIVDETREALLQFWEQGWQTLFDSVSGLKDEDFARTVTIRGQPHTVVQAIDRQLTHYAYHVGQIVFLAKHFRADAWQTLSVPKNRSEDFNKFLAQKKAAGEPIPSPLESPLEFANKEKAS